MKTKTTDSEQLPPAFTLACKDTPTLNSSPVFSKGAHEVIVKFSRKLAEPPTLTLFSSGKEIAVFTTSKIDEKTYKATICIQNSYPDGIAILKLSGIDENGLKF